MYSKIIPKEDPGVIVDHLFRIFDRDGNGTIDFKEFVMATDMTTAGAPEEKLKWTFRVSVVSRIFIFLIIFVISTKYYYSFKLCLDVI